MYNKYLVNNIWIAFLPIITRRSHPTENGVKWKTNTESQERESEGGKNYENPVNSAKKTPQRSVQSLSPDKSKHDDTLTMHTLDMMSTLKRSIMTTDANLQSREQTPSLAYRALGDEE